MSEQKFDGGQTDATPEQVRRTIRACVKHSEWDVELVLEYGASLRRRFPTLAGGEANDVVPTDDGS